MKLIERIEDYDGFGSAEGQIIDRGEIFHSLVPGMFLGVAGGAPMFVSVMTLLQTAKGVSGHIKDLKKEIGYFIAGFGIVEIAQTVFPGII